MQERHEPHPLESRDGNDVRAVAVDLENRVFAATKDGLYILENGKWISPENAPKGPMYDLYIDGADGVWVGSWDGLYRIADDHCEKIREIHGAISCLAGDGERIIALGPDDSWIYLNNEWRSVPRTWSGDVNDIAIDKDGSFWVAAGMGLHHVASYGSRYYYQDDELYSSEVNAAAFAPDGRLWLGELGGIDVYENGVRVDTVTSDDGLPYYDVRTLAFAPDGRLWVGTGLGAARYDGESWSLRHSRRWLLSDDVRDIAFDSNGGAWIATANGVSAIKTRMMTLKDKADHYLEICLKRHVREPWFVEKCFFPDPSNKNFYKVRDDDNDGSYTGFYMVMECFRYAVTQDPQAKANADRAFEALEMLQTITDTDGFLARTMIPSNWTEMADPNRTYTPQQKAEMQVRDPRYKPVEERWRSSSDQKWLWKGDTSSDEITGHMFAYLFYYDLAADAERKERVRRLVAKIMDSIIGGGYVLRDIDGKHTRWGVWSPEKLNHDPNWRVEKPINSFEILSFLKAAHHITGDETYQNEYKKLIEQHGYAQNARRPKSYGRADRTHIDDELFMFAAPALLLYEDDPELLAIYREALTWVYRTVENDQNPFFNFMFGCLGGNNFHLDESAAFLRDQPLDLTQWRIDNSRREDIRLVRHPMLEPLQTSRMLPPSERGVMRWDKNPWDVISGDFSDPEGRLESSGVFWLTPYWMGRYYGYIEAPK